MLYYQLPSVECFQARHEEAMDLDQFSDVMAENACLIHTTITNGDLPTLRRLTENGAFINYSLGMRGTPLCAAISANQAKVVQFLLNVTNDATTPDFDGEAPLSLAIRKQYKECTKILIQSGKCNLNQVDCVTLNPPICNALNYEGQVDVMKWLIDAGCDVNREGKFGRTVLHYAVLNQNIEAIKLLLTTHSTQVNKHDKHGKAPIHLAAVSANHNILDVLIRNYPRKRDGGVSDFVGLDINKPSIIDGNTPLHEAVVHANAECMQVLLESYCKVNQQNNAGQTALYIACATNRIDLAAMVLTSGADANIMCRQSSYTSNTYMDKIQTAPVHIAIVLGHDLLVKTLARHGADLNLRNSMGQTPLHLALIRNQADIADYLLQEAEDNHTVDVNVVDNLNATPIFFLTYCKLWSKIGRRLVRLGCDVNRADKNGKRPLHAAMEQDSIEVVRMLLSNGADPNAIFEGHTPLQACAFEDQEDVALDLLRHGADMYTATEDGEMALRIALENNSLEVVKLLLNCGYNVSREGFSEDPAHAHKLPFYMQDEKDHQLRQLIFRHAREPTKLILQCRSQIRQAMLNSQIPSSKWTELPVPKRMLDFLQLNII